MLNRLKNWFRNRRKNSTRSHEFYKQTGQSEAGYRSSAKQIENRRNSEYEYDNTFANPLNPLNPISPLSPLNPVHQVGGYPEAVPESPKSQSIERTETPTSQPTTQPSSYDVEAPSSSVYSPPSSSHSNSYSSSSDNYSSSSSNDNSSSSSSYDSGSSSPDCGSSSSGGDF